MMNGQSRLADRERVKRYAEATDQKQYDVQDSIDSRDYSQRNGKQATLFRENTGQHYPGFADTESKKPISGPVKFVKPKPVNSKGHKISEDRYKEEISAQSKRAQALAFLQQTDDGVPDDCLKGEAAQKRARAKRSALSRDNTLQLVGEQNHDNTLAALEQKLLSVQSQLRRATAAAPGSLGAAPVPGAPPREVNQPIILAQPLPPGWRAERHTASKQTYFICAATGEKRWTPPESADDRTDMPDRLAEARDAKKREASGSAGGDEKKKKYAIDPMDPAGITGGRWTGGLHHKGERMADSTASGPLWQQRPYPAPSAVLKMRGPGVREGTSIGPSMPGPAPSTNRRPPPPPPGAHFQPRNVHQQGLKGITLATAGNAMGDKARRATQRP